SGVVRSASYPRRGSGRLAVRNRIYARVFDRAWIQQHMPDAELRRQQAAYRRGLARAALISGLVLLVIAGLGLLAWSQARRADRSAGRKSRRKRAGDTCMPLR